MQKEKNIEDYLEQSYWVVDILPRQVAPNGGGQYFRIEDYFLEHPRIDDIHGKFTAILLKLNCYVDICVSQDGEEWTKNPPPHDLVKMMKQCLSANSILYFLLETEDMLITVCGDDTYMTIYHPSEEILELLRSLAASEGLFVWNPLRPHAAY